MKINFITGDENLHIDETFVPGSTNAVESREIQRRFYRDESVISALHTRTGFIALDSVNQLPENPDEREQTAGFIIGRSLYVYVGEGGDVAGGRYRNCGEFKGPKGDQGNTGSSVDYPFELVNNLVTDDPTKGLTASMGKELSANISSIKDSLDEISSIYNEPASSSFTVHASTFFMYQPIDPSMVGKTATAVRISLPKIETGPMQWEICTLKNHDTPAYYVSKNIIASGSFAIDSYSAGDVAEIPLDTPVEIPENAYLYLRAYGVPGNYKVIPTCPSPGNKVYRCYSSDPMGDDGWRIPTIYNDTALMFAVVYDAYVAKGVGSIGKLDVDARESEVALQYKGIAGEDKESLIPKATTTSAGVMSAKDKAALDELNGGVVTGTPVSDAFKAEVEDTVEKVKDLSSAASLSLLIISDPHERVTNAQYVRRMNATFNNLKAVAKGVKVDGAMSLGDIFWATGTEESGEGPYHYVDQDVCNDHFRSYSERFSKVHENIYMLIGNHDGIGASFNSNTNTAMYPYMQKYMEGYTERNADSLYFWFDRPDIKTRCVCLASPDQDGSYRWMSTDQLRWLAHTALDVEDGWNVLIFCHTRPDVGDIILKDTLFGIVNAFGRHETYHDSYIDVDYTGYESVKMVAWVCGHQHYDRVQYRDDFVCPIVYIPSPNPAVIGSGTLPEGATNPPKSYTEGTLGADCWDALVFRPDEGKIHLVRFGAGDDREVTVDANAVEYDAERLSLNGLEKSMVDKAYVDAELSKKADQSELSELEEEINGASVQEIKAENVLLKYINSSLTWVSGNASFVIDARKAIGHKVSTTGVIQYAFVDSNESTLNKVVSTFDGRQSGNIIEKEIPASHPYIYMYVGNSLVTLPTITIADTEGLKHEVECVRKNIGDKDSLKTEDKSSLVDAINEVNDKAGKKGNSNGGYVEQSGRESITFHGNTLILSEKEPMNVKVERPVKILGRNRFNLVNAEFKPSSSKFDGVALPMSITKSGTGVKITREDFPYGAQGIYYYADYTAEIDGELCVSCNASSKESSSKDSFRNLIMSVQLQKQGGAFVEQQKTYGEGLLYLFVDVEKGDIVRLRFCAKSEKEVTEACALEYNDIMISYGGLYPYSHYKEDVQNVKYEYETLLVPADSTNWSAKATSVSGKTMVISRNAFGIPTDFLPIDNNSVSDIKVDGLPLVSYNAAYNCNYGIGIGAKGTSNEGKIVIYLTGGGTNEAAEFLKSNPVVLKFKVGEPVFDSDFTHEYQQGEIIKAEEDIDATYSHLKNTKDIRCFCMGDSITGMFKNKTDYPSMITSKSNIQCYNGGFAGSTTTDHNSSTYVPFSLNRLVDAKCNGDWSAQDEKISLASASRPEYVDRLKAWKDVDFNTIDYITLLQGINDWGYGVTYLTREDAPQSTREELSFRQIFDESLVYAVDKLAEEYPHLRFVILTPYDGKMGELEVGGANAKGKKLKEYADAIVGAAESFNVLTINLFKTFGSNNRNIYFYSYDKGHPNERSKHSIANKIVNAIMLDREGVVKYR